MQRLEYPPPKQTSAKEKVGRAKAVLRYQGGGRVVPDTHIGEPGAKVWALVNEITAKRAANAAQWKP